MTRSPLISLPLALFFATLVLGAFQVVGSSFGPRAISPSSLTGAYEQGATQGVFNGKAVVSTPVVTHALAKNVLGAQDAPKRIEVDLATQHLTAFEGDQKVYDFVVSTGKWYPTPTGTFHIWGKFKYTKMSGGNPLTSTYYYLPNVPFVQFFSNDEIAAARGFSLHGVYWHNNFGHPMSHGCVNMRTEDAEVLFNWTNPTVDPSLNSILASKLDQGTEVRIFGTPPTD